MTEISPRGHDEAEAALYDQASKAQFQLDSHTDTMHGMAGDRKSYLGRELLWNMTGAQVLDQIRAAIAAGNERNVRYGMTPSDALARDGRLRARLADLMIRLEEMEQVWRRHRWTRYFPCMNRDGHIHRSLRECPTVRFETAMAWTPQLSGKSVADAIAELGPRLCSVCFPDAPAEHCRSLPEIEREQRLAERAAREEAKLVKRLAETEQFRDHRGDRVETVAACKQILRDERELNYYYGRGPHPWHSDAVKAAEQATRVLLARELAKPGTGAAQAEIDKIIKTADKKQRKEAGLA